MRMCFCGLLVLFTVFACVHPSPAYLLAPPLPACLPACLPRCFASQQSEPLAAARQQAELLQQQLAADLQRARGSVAAKNLAVQQLHMAAEQQRQQADEQEQQEAARRQQQQAAAAAAAAASAAGAPRPAVASGRPGAKARPAPAPAAVARKAAKEEVEEIEIIDSDEEVSEWR